MEAARRTGLSETNIIAQRTRSTNVGRTNRRDGAENVADALNSWKSTLQGKNASSMGKDRCAKLTQEIVHLVHRYEVALKELEGALDAVAATDTFRERRCESKHRENAMCDANAEDPPTGQAGGAGNESITGEDDGRYRKAEG